MAAANCKMCENYTLKVDFNTLELEALEVKTSAIKYAAYVCHICSNLWN